MKTNILLAGIALLFAACSNNDNETIVDNNAQAPVTVRVDGFSISQNDFPGTRATAIGEYTSVKAITLAFYKSDGTEVYKHTQFKSDESTYTTFGEFSTSLPMGSFTMVVLGYYQGADPHAITLTSPTSAAFTEDAARETFAATQQFTVNSNDPKELTATLNRIISRLRVVSTDGRTADMNGIRVTFAGGSKSFNPTTGLATDNNGLNNTVYPTAAVGSTTTTSYFLFLATDEQTMNVTIETLDAEDNVLFTKTIENVPFKRNRVTTLTGAMYSAAASAGSFQLNTEWIDPEDDIEF